MHRGLYRISGGRFLWAPSNKRGYGALRLTTTGRTSGQERSVILGYLEDGPNLVTLAMNGWIEGHPAWWLNLEAQPEAVVRLDGEEPRPVRARTAVGPGARPAVEASGPRSTRSSTPTPRRGRP